MIGAWVLLTGVLTIFIGLCVIASSIVKDKMELYDHITSIFGALIGAVGILIIIHALSGW